MHEETGRRLAIYLAQANVSSVEILTKRLSDYLPTALLRGGDRAETIVRVCAEIPVYCLQSSPISHEDFTAAIYRLLDRLNIHISRHGDVLNFFRSFCQEFFLSGSRRVMEVPPSSVPSPRLVTGGRLQDSPEQSQIEAAELSRILATRSHLLEHVRQQQAAEIPVNFNDLLAILQESHGRGELQRAVEQEDANTDTAVLYATLVKVIEGMTAEERLDPALLLDHYDAARRYRRRAGIAARAELSLSLVDHCLAALAEFRRNYQLYLQRTSSS